MQLNMYSGVYRCISVLVMSGAAGYPGQKNATFRFREKDTDI